MASSLYSLSKELNEALFESDADFDAPVKIELPDGTELTVTHLEVETNIETDEQVAWLKVVEE